MTGDLPRFFVGLRRSGDVWSSLPRLPGRTEIQDRGRHAPLLEQVLGEAETEEVDDTRVVRVGPLVFGALRGLSTDKGREN